MNERIRELAEQAARDTQRKHNNVYWWMQDEMPADATWREKFAELIVRECLNTVGHYANVDEGIAVAKKNFGVE